MTEEKKGLVREQGNVRPRTGRVERCKIDERDARDEDDGRGLRVERAADDDTEADGTRARRRSRRGVRGRPPLRDEVGDLNRGAAFVGAESVAIAVDVFSRVLRGIVERAFDEDYVEPGDVARGLANEADLAAYDVVDEMRSVPHKLERRFQQAIRSPRADRGERARRDRRE